MEPLPGTRGAGVPFITAWPPRSQGRSPGNQAGSTDLLPVLSLQGKAAGRSVSVLRASREALGLLPWGPRWGTGPWLRVKDSGRALTERGLALADRSWGLRREPRDAPGTAGRRQTGQRSVLEATTPPKEKNLRPRRQDSSQLKNALPTEGQRGTAGRGAQGRGPGCAGGTDSHWTMWGRWRSRRLCSSRQRRGEKLQQGITQPQSSSLSLCFLGCPTMANRITQWCP